MNLALLIQEKEGGDRLVIAIASFLHDIHRIIEKKTGKYCYPKDSLARVSKILKTIELTKEEKEKILHSIEFHEEYNFTETGKTVNDTETLILQDADNLDAIGAISIARSFTYGGVHNMTIWNPKKQTKGRSIYDETKNDSSTIDHLYSKALKLKDNMNTKTGERLAQKRHEFTEQFLDEFFREWNEGKKIISKG